MKSTMCKKCGIFCKNCNIVKHEKVCDGSVKNSVKGKCQFCKKTAEELNLERKEMGNHVRWCHLKPKTETDGVKKNFSEIRIHEMNIKRKQTGYLNQYSKAKINGNTFFISEETKTKMSKSSAGRKHTETTKQKLSLIMKKRMENGPLPTKNCIDFCNLKGITFKLDSKWEQIMAEKLNNFGINWIRGKKLNWVDIEGKTHIYFPDFYLEDFDIYIEIKNPFLMKKDEFKVNYIKNNYPNIIWLDSKKAVENFEL